MKRLLISIIGIFLFVGVVALGVGDIITQNQLDNYNLVSINDLQPSWVLENDNLKIGDCNFDKSICNTYLNVGRTLNKIDNDNYNVTTTVLKVPFRTERYYKIATDYNKSLAFDALQRDQNKKAKYILSAEADKINNWKTTQDTSPSAEILDIVNGGVVNEI